MERVRVDSPHSVRTCDACRKYDRMAAQLLQIKANGEIWNTIPLCESCAREIALKLLDEADRA